MNEKEIRLNQDARLQVRAAGGDSPEGITGYAALFNVRSVDLGGFVEEIVPGAFARTLASNPDVRMTIEHAGGLSTIARTRNGTLQLWEDEVGLRFDAVPADTAAGRDAMTLVKRGDVDQMSFAFRVARENQEWEQLSETMVLRRLLHVDLHDGDVSLVSYPAYPQTSAEARDEAAARQAGSARNEAAEDARLQARRAARRRNLMIREKAR